ncbi:helix-turn-helix domain-containing protein [Thermanaeromonas sp. C210]|uniref:helix-turn-helix domain-containing protein n=1 Tax=Thermanaeromonas sp. C210 TaxID=2731925 RepID=UPI00155BBF69|nr:helix-turn-helix transcriptional regulator [Thermanaeromonas sp. C210]GFN23248.1 transcriptional regulator [Thermanaeromonas sp. C210]
MSASIGPKLRQLRMERGISLEALADMLDIAPDCMREVEEGTRRLSAATLAEVASILGVDASYFQEENGSPPGGDNNQLGAKLRRLREQKGLTLNELSRKSGVSLAHISEIERGRSTASLKTLEKLAAALEVSTSSLLQAERGESLGSKLRRLREKMGLTQKELADQVGISHSLIGQIETDRILPSLTTLHRLSEALGVSSCYFLMEDEVPLPSSLQRSAVQELVNLLRSWGDEEIRGLIQFVRIINQYRPAAVEGHGGEKEEIVSFLDTCLPEERELLRDLVRTLRRKRSHNDGL